MVYKERGDFRVPLSFSVPNPFECDGRVVLDAFHKNSVPGLSIKKTCIQVIDITPRELAGLLPPQYYIVGSGIYLDSAESCGKEMTSKDDDGCAISAPSNTPRSVLFTYS